MLGTVGSHQQGFGLESTRWFFCVEFAGFLQVAQLLRMLLMCRYSTVDDRSGHQCMIVCEWNTSQTNGLKNLMLV